MVGGDTAHGELPGCCPHQPGEIVYYLFINGKKIKRNRLKFLFLTF